MCACVPFSTRKTLHSQGDQSIELYRLHVWLHQDFRGVPAQTNEFRAYLVHHLTILKNMVCVCALSCTCCPHNNVSSQGDQRSELYPLQVLLHQDASGVHRLDGAGGGGRPGVYRHVVNHSVDNIAVSRHVLHFEVVLTRIVPGIKTQKAAYRVRSVSRCDEEGGGPGTPSCCQARLREECRWT